MQSKVVESPHCPAEHVSAGLHRGCPRFRIDVEPRRDRREPRIDRSAPWMVETLETQEQFSVPLRIARPVQSTRSM